MSESEYSTSQLSQAAAIKEQIEKLQLELTSVLGMNLPAAPAATSASAPQKRTLRGATKRKLCAFHKARWAKIKAAKTSQDVVAPMPASKAAPAIAPAPKMWKLSAAGMA